MEVTNQDWGSRDYSSSVRRPATFIQAIKQAPSIRKLFLFSAKKCESFNQIHWTVFCDHLHALQKGKLRGGYLDQFVSYVPTILNFTYTAGQLAQILRCIGACEVTSEQLLDALVIQSTDKVDEFTDPELHMLLSGLSTRPYSKKLDPLLDSLVQRFSDRDYGKRVSPATLAIWIKTYIKYKGPPAHASQMVLLAKERICDFREAEMGELVTALEPIYYWKETVELLQACEERILNLPAPSARSWATFLTAFGNAKFHSPKLADQALKATSPSWKVWDKIGVARGIAKMGIPCDEGADLILGLQRHPEFARTWLEDQCNLLWAQVFLLGRKRAQEAHPLITHLLDQRANLDAQGRSIVNQAMALTDYSPRPTLSDLSINDVIISPEQQEITQAIQQLCRRYPELNPVIVQSEAPCDYTSVDILLPNLTFKGQPIAIECNGSQHYAANNRSPTGKTLLKEAMIAKMGWHLLTIDTYEWRENIGELCNWLLENGVVSSTYGGEGFSASPQSTHLPELGPLPSQD